MEDHAPYAAQYLEKVRTNDSSQTKLEYHGRHFDDEHAEKLAQAMQSNNVLQKLAFTDNKLSDKGLEHLIGALDENTSVTDLDLSRNQITDEGCKSLLFCMRHHNHRLTTVNLKDNDVSDELLKDLEASCILNSQPLALKLALVRMSGDGVMEVDFSGTTDPKPYTLASTQLLAGALGRDSILQVINFSNNNVGDERTVTLMEGLRLNQTLRELHLQHNEITCNGVIAIAEVLRHNTGLVELNLKDNKISNFGADALVDCLTVNNHLALMNLQMNNMDSERLEKIVTSLMLNGQPRELKKQLPNIQMNSTMVSRILLGELPKDARNHVTDITCRVLLNSLRLNTVVQFVDLSNNKITDEGAGFLAQLLKYNATVNTLLLNNNQIGDEGGAALHKALRDNHVVKVLELDGNPISPDIQKSLALAVALNSEPYTFKQKAPMLLADDPSLELLDFSQVQEAECSDRTIDLMSEMAPQNTHLKELSMVHCPKVSRDGFKMVADMLSRNEFCGLTALDMSQNGLGNAGAGDLAKMLKTNSSLVELLIRQNEITSASEFVSVLREDNNTLTTLDLSGNTVPVSDLSDIDLLTRLNAQPLEFKGYVLDLFANAPTLCELSLCEFGKIGEGSYCYKKAYNDSSVLLLCEALRQNTVLTNLDLQGNNITDVGAQHLADLVGFNQTLTSLNLNNNKIGDQGFLRLAKALYKNESIGMVSTEGNAIHPDTRRKINHATHNVLGSEQQKYDKLVAASQLMDENEMQKKIEDQILVDALVDSGYAKEQYRMMNVKSLMSDYSQLTAM